jgi:hypothetical protein
MRADIGRVFMSEDYTLDEAYDYIINKYEDYSNDSTPKKTRKLKIPKSAPTKRVVKSRTVQPKQLVIDVSDDEVNTEEDEEVYEVEKIVDKRYHGRVEYLVHWRGYSVSERTWEPICNLENCSALREQFDRYHKKPRRSL